MASYAPGETIRLKYAHEGKNKLVSVTLGCTPYSLQESAAKAWREMRDKPPLPEIVNREQILAENSIAEKDFYAASYHYGRGLADYSYWPEGWYNMALIDKELQLWAYAALEMKQYLLLEPDASDARDANAQIIIWEEKAKETSAGATASK